MFIDNKTGKKAFLHSHDSDAVYSVGDPSAARHTVPSDVFFSTHREADRDELNNHYGEGAKLAARDPLAAARAGKAAARAAREAAAGKDEKAPDRKADAPPAGHQQG